MLVPQNGSIETLILQCWVLFCIADDLVGKKKMNNLSVLFILQFVPSAGAGGPQSGRGSPRCSMVQYDPFSKIRCNCLLSKAVDVFSYFKYNLIYSQESKISGQIYSNSMQH